MLAALEIVHSYPNGMRSLATANEAQPAPTSAIFFPFDCSGAFADARDVVSQIGGDTLKSANRDRLSSTRPRRQAAHKAGRTLDPRCRGNVRPAISEVRFGVVPLCNESDGARHVSVCWTSPLTVDDTMKILRSDVLVGFILAFALLISPVVGRPIKADYHIEALFTQQHYTRHLLYRRWIIIG